MTDLAAFLAARLDETQKTAEGLRDMVASLNEINDRRSAATRQGTQVYDAASWALARVLAEIAAKRALVKHLANWTWLDPENDEGYDADDIRLSESHETSLKLLAASWASHPDFDESWRT